MMEKSKKMQLNRGITYSDIYSVNCFYYTGAFELNRHLFCEIQLKNIKF